MTEHDLEVTNLHLEMAQMNAKIIQLENNVEFLQTEIQKVTQLKVEEIVAIILSTQDGGKQSRHDEYKEASENEEDCVKCDICNFKSRGEWTMINT